MIRFIRVMVSREHGTEGIAHMDYRYERLRRRRRRIEEAAPAMGEGGEQAVGPVVAVA